MVNDCDSEGSGEGSYDSEESDESPPPRRAPPAPIQRPNPPRRPAPSLSVLQAAWGPDAAVRAAGVERPCACCQAPDSQYRCSRCGLVRYCGRTCQGRYHAVHKLECIGEFEMKDAGLSPAVDVGNDIQYHIGLYSRLLLRLCSFI